MPWWNAMPPPAKNTDQGNCTRYSRLVWPGAFHRTVNSPRGVGVVTSPVVIRAGEPDRLGTRWLGTGPPGTPVAPPRRLWQAAAT